MSSKKTLHFQEQDVEYTMRRYRRARNLRLTVNCDASVVLTVPRFVSLRQAEAFVQRKASWIIEKIGQFQHQHTSDVYWCCKGAPAHFLCYKEQAQLLVNKKLEQFNFFYNYKYTAVKIRNQKSRWGSCSKSGRLSFNYKLAFLDEKLVDYVVVHELCHLKEMNHSANFWKLVEQTVPDYWVRRKELMAKRF